MFQKQARLSEPDLRAIKRIFRQHFLPNDCLWLFGSRTDLTRKGGDIDLYIETHAIAEDALKRQLSFLCGLEKAIGEQKVDVVLNLINSNHDLPIYTVAKTTGVQLVINRFDEALKVADIHAERIKQAQNHIGHLFPASLEAGANIGEDDIAWVDMFVYRFNKLQDYIGQHLIDAFFIEKREMVDHLTMIDKLNKLERLEIIDDVSTWNEMRKLRNYIAHEYPDEPEKTFLSINQIFILTPKLLSILDNFKKKAGRL